MTTLPIDPDSEFQSFSVTLDGKVFGFELRWNARAEAWVFALSDANGAPLLAGRRIVVGFPLLGRFADARLPSGELLAVDTTGASREAGFGDLGRRVELVYYAAAELST